MPIESPEERDEKRIEKLKAEVIALNQKIDELKKSEEGFLSIFDGMAEIYFECDLFGNLTHFNPAVCRISGYTPQELTGKNHRQYSSPEMSKRMFEAFHEMYRTGKPVQISDYEVSAKDGHPIYLEISAYVIRDGKDRPIGFRGFGRDITERIKTENELHESEERFRRLNDASFCGVFTHDQGIIVDCNDEMAKLTGYKYEELIGKNGLELICAPESRSKVMTVIQSGEEKVYEMIALRKDGTKFPVEMHSKQIPFHGKNLRISEIRDVTERRKFEEALKKSRLRYRQLYKEAQESEELYQSLLNSSADAVVILDTDQRFEFINPSFTKIFGWTLDDLQDKKIAFVPKPLRESFKATIDKVIEEGDAIHGLESQRYAKDGRLMDVSLSISRYLDHAGDPAGVLITLRDISEAKKYLWHMYQAQKMESLGTMASGIAHDFNNLLMGIQGRLSLLMMNMQHSHPNYTHLKDVEEYIIRASELTRQLLGIGRSDKYEPAPTDMNELIQKHNRMFGRTRKEIVIHEELDNTLMTAEADQRQIEQVLLNMYVNASHAMPRGGDLYIRTQNDRLDSRTTEPYEIPPGNFIKISITDTGIGMDEATRKRVFEPFFTTKKKEQGTGLGLASAYGIIKHHGGFITVYSEVGRGTTFNIYLPASGKAVVKEMTSKQEIIEGEGTILLIDDEEMILSVAEEMVRALGYDTLCARGGQEALEVYRKNQKTISMVILDLIMPGLSGREVFDQLRQMNPHARILLASGYTVDGEASSVMNRGCNGFIQKPFNIQELSKKISDVLSSKA